MDGYKGMNKKYWISASGGLGSAISCILAHEFGLDYEMIFADTLIEDEDLYRFIWEISMKLNKPLIYLKDGRTPWVALPIARRSLKQIWFVAIWMNMLRRVMNLF